MGRGDETGALLVLLALAAALYLTVWWIERPEGDTGLPVPVQEAAPDRS